MFKYVLVMAVLRKDRLQPAGSISPRLFILVFARVPDMMEEASIVGHVREDDVDRSVTVFCGEVLGVAAKFDQVLEENIDHRWVEATSPARASRNGDFLDELTAVG